MKPIRSNPDSDSDLDKELEPVPFDTQEAYELIEDLDRVARRFEWNSIGPVITRLITMLPGMKRSLYKYKNTVTSVREGMDLLGPTAAKKELKQAYDELSFAMGVAIGGLQQKNTLPDDLAHDVDFQVLKTYDRNMNEIQARIQKDGTFVGYTPVLALTSPQFSVTKLKSKGILASTFADYAILNKQFVAGISNDYIRAAMPRMKTADKAAISKQFVKTKDEILPEFKELVLKKFARLHLAEVADPSFWWDATWLWLVPSKEFEIMKSCTVVSNKVASLQVKKWAFPFENRG